MTAAEHKSDLKHTKNTSYLALTGELWSVYCEEIGETWPRYNGTGLYLCRLQQCIKFEWSIIQMLC